MVRIKQHIDRDMTSSPDDISLVERSSTEDHVDLSSRDMSAADHHIPSPASVLDDISKDAYPSVQKYNVLNSRETPVRSVLASPICIKSRAYTPLPFMKRNTPAPETEQKSELEVKPSVSLYTADIDAQLVDHTAVKVPRIYSPVPYSRHCTFYSPIHWQKRLETNSPGESPSDDAQIDDKIKVEEKNLSEVHASKENSTSSVPVKAPSKTTIDDVHNVTDASDTSMPATVDKTPEKKSACTEPEDSKQMQEMKTIYEAHLKEKEEFETLIQKRENEINEQLSEMDEVMESMQSEHAMIEEVAGAFVDAIEAHTNSKEEATRVRVQNKEQEISSDILFAENAELKEEISGLSDHISAINDQQTDEKVKSKKELLCEVPDSDKISTRRVPVTAASIITDDDVPNFTDASDILEEVDKTTENKKACTDPEDSKEMQKLKNIYEAHLREKEEFEKLIEKREYEINEQLSEMDEVMESMQSEHAKMEKVAGAFADAIKTHTNYRDEATRVRVQKREQEISADILFAENAELKEEIRELYDHINEIKERRTKGLNELRQDTKEMERSVISVKDENEEIEVETKEKIEEFNTLRMAVMDKGITYVKKEKIIQGIGDIAVFQRPGTSGSPSPSNIQSGLEIEISGISHISPDIGTPRKDRTIKSNKLSEIITEKNVVFEENERSFAELESKERNEYMEALITEKNEKKDLSTGVNVLNPHSAQLTNEIIQQSGFSACAFKDERSWKEYSNSNTPVRQLSAVELVRQPGTRDGNSKIPKPHVQPYGSASRDGDRFMVSESSSFVLTQCKNYKRDALVSKDQKHVTKLTMEFLEPEVELRRLKVKFGHMGEYMFNEQNDWLDEKRHKEKKRWIDRDANNEITRCSVTTKEFEEELDGSKKRQTDDRFSIYSVKKQENAPKKCKKKEIKSKIDTGLKNRPFNVKTNKPEMNVHSVPKLRRSASGKDAKNKPEPVKNNNRIIKPNVKKEQPCVRAKKQCLPPLKNAPMSIEKSNDIPRSSTSFGNKTPLPNIKAIGRKDVEKAKKENVASRQVLPPIKSSKIKQASNSLRNKDREDRPTQKSSKKLLPDVVKGSFIPAPPTHAPRSRKPASMMLKLQSSKQDDNKRVSHERA